MTLDDLERPKRHSLQKLKKVLRSPPVAKCRPMTPFSRNKRHMRIFARVLREVASNDSGVVEDGNLRRFNCYLIGNFRQDI